MRVKGEFYPHKYPPLVSEWLFDQVQDVMAGHHKAPVHYAGHPILFRGLITCEHCGCTATSDIEKKKYIYYSCNNSKRTCKKIWTREEQLLAPLLEYFDKIRLTDAQIESVVASLKQSYAHEQEFFKHSQETLRKELDQIQSRLSKLLDMHLDGGIDSETYHLKWEEYKKRQREITSEMKAHINADETCLITAKTVLDLAKRAKEIFISSKLPGKTAIVEFCLFELEVGWGKAVIDIARVVFDPMCNVTSTSESPDTGYSSNFSLERLSAKIGQIPSTFYFPRHKNTVETYCRLI